MYRLSNDIAPEMVRDPSAPLVLLGPVALTLGAINTLATSVRLVGNVETRSCLMFVATCAVSTNAEALAVTVTASVNLASDRLTSASTVCVAPTSIIRVMVSKRSTRTGPRTGRAAAREGCNRPLRM
jgi:hypothetical protein